VIPHQKPTLYVAVFFNERSAIFKDNKPLRQALSYAIDKSNWKDKRALGPIPEQSWAYNAQVKPYDFDVARAKELLSPVIPKGQTLNINLTTAPTLLQVADKIAKDWAQVGIHTQIQAASSLPSDYDAYLTLYEVSLDPDQYLTWHSTQESTNVTHFANQRIDKLLEDGRLEMDLEKRKKMYLDFQRFLLEDAPAAFLYHPTSFDIIRK
jgi:peptide/nickel transport system substrate-binding protein